VHLDGQQSVDRKVLLGNYSAASLQSVR